MEDNLNIFEKEDDLDFFQMEDDLNFVLGNLVSLFSVCNLISNQLEEIWKTTSIFLKMEYNLKFFSNGRQLQDFGKWKTT